MLKTPNKSRREFLGLCVSSAAALSEGALGEGERLAAEGKSTVAIAHDDRLRGADGRLGGRGIATSPVLAAAICERLQQAGVRAGDIAVWNRDSTEMERAGGCRARIFGQRDIEHCGQPADRVAVRDIEAPCPKPH